MNSSRPPPWVGWDGSLDLKFCVCAPCGSSKGKVYPVGPPKIETINLLGLPSDSGSL